MTECPNGGDLTWLTPGVAVCPCHTRNVWRQNPRTRRLVGDWNGSARELADALLAVEHRASGQVAVLLGIPTPSSPGT